MARSAVSNTLAALVLCVLVASVGLGVYFSYANFGATSSNSKQGTATTQLPAAQRSSNLSSAEAFTTSYLYTTTSAYQRWVLTGSKSYSYDDIPPSLALGNFTIQLVDNQTGYETPPVNGTSRIITAFVFAFNVSSPQQPITNIYSIWWPPCSSNLGLPCMQNNTWVQPSPENWTVNASLASLLVHWFLNGTGGLFVSFQEWDLVSLNTTYVLYSDSPPATTSNNETVEVSTYQLAPTCAGAGIDEGEAVRLVLNSSQVEAYTSGAYSYNWQYSNPWLACRSTSSLQPAEVVVNITGTQEVTGTWASGYTITFAHNVIIWAYVSPSYQLIGLNVTKQPDSLQLLNYSLQQQQVIRAALSNSSVQQMIGKINYYVEYVSAPIGAGNQTFANDYYVVLDQVNGNLSLGIYVSSSNYHVVGAYPLQVCRQFGWNGNIC